MGISATGAAGAALAADRNQGRGLTVEKGDLTELWQKYGTVPQLIDAWFQRESARERIAEEEARAEAEAKARAKKKKQKPL